MTLLTICQDVADVIGLTRPTAIVTDTTQLPRQMLGFAKETVDELSRMDWPVLEVAYTFPTVAGQASYTLPVDFKREIGDSVYAATSYTQIRGSLTASDWARQRSSMPGIGRYRFRIYGYPQKLYISPTPQVAETIVMEYQTCNKVVDSTGALKTAFTLDSDMPMVAEELVRKGLKWRLRRAKGLDYSEEFDDYENDRSTQLAQALGMGSMAVAYRSPYDSDSGLGNPYVPDHGFG